MLPRRSARRGGAARAAAAAAAWLALALALTLALSPAAQASDNMLAYEGYSYLDASGSAVSNAAAAAYGLSAAAAAAPPPAGGAGGGAPVSFATARWVAAHAGGGGGGGAPGAAAARGQGPPKAALHRSPAPASPEDAPAAAGTADAPPAAAAAAPPFLPNLAPAAAPATEPRAWDTPRPQGQPPQPQPQPPGANTTATVARREAAADSVAVSAFRPMIVLLGDSITEFGAMDGGWQQLLTKEYTRKADVINRGFGGYNSRWGTYLTDEILNSFGGGRVKLVTIAFGANDAIAPGKNMGYLSVPLDEFIANLKAMVSKLKAAGVDGVIMVTPPPVDDSGGKFSDGSRSNARLKQYADAVISTAKELGLPYVDIFDNFQKEDGWRGRFMEYDGVHLSKEGNKALFNSVVSAIGSAYPQLSAKRLPLHFPPYMKVNAANPAETFDGLYGYAVDRGAAAPAPAPNAANGGGGGSGGSGGRGGGSGGGGNGGNAKNAAGSGGNGGNSSGGGNGGSAKNASGGSSGSSSSGAGNGGNAKASSGGSGGSSSNGGNGGNAKASNGGSGGSSGSSGNSGNAKNAGGGSSGSGGSGGSSGGGGNSGGSGGSDGGNGGGGGNGGSTKSSPQPSANERRPSGESKSGRRRLLGLR